VHVNPPPLGLSSNSDWVVMCSRNTATPGQVSGLAMGITVHTATGGWGNVQLSVNTAYMGEPTDFQLSRIYVWDYHLTDDMFFGVSDALISYLAGTPCQCPPGHSCPDSGDAALPQAVPLCTDSSLLPTWSLHPPYLVREHCCKALAVCCPACRLV
jgi:hypothetical protein